MNEYRITTDIDHVATFSAKDDVEAITYAKEVIDPSWSAFEKDSQTLSKTTRTVYDLQAVDPDRSGIIERIVIEHDVIEPVCDHVSGAHVWRDQGAYGRGAGVASSEICCNCGITHHVESNYQDPQTGEQGLTFEEYRSAAFFFEPIGAYMCVNDSFDPEGSVLYTDLVDFEKMVEACHGEEDVPELDGSQGSDYDWDDPARGWVTVLKWVPGAEA